jgi:hypothetical protein
MRGFFPFDFAQGQNDKLRRFGLNVRLAGEVEGEVGGGGGAGAGGAAEGGVAGVEEGALD